MKTIDIHDATAPLTDYLNVVMREPVIIMSSGKPLMALMDVEDLDFETISLSFNSDFMELIQHSRTRLEQEGGISREEMRRRLGMDE